MIKCLKTTEALLGIETNDVTPDRIENYSLKTTEALLGIETLLLPAAWRLLHVSKLLKPF